MALYFALAASGEVVRIDASQRPPPSEPQPPFDPETAPDWFRNWPNPPYDGPPTVNPQPGVHDWTIPGPPSVGRPDPLPPTPSLD